MTLVVPFVARSSQDGTECKQQPFLFLTPFFYPSPLQNLTAPYLPPS